MRLILTGLALALAACNNAGSAANDSSADAGNTAPVSATDGAAPANLSVPPTGPVPEGNAAAPDNGSATAGGQSRAALLADCTSGAPGNVPEGTDVAALCGCAVDKVLAGAGQNESIRQCAAEQNVRLNLG
ncbi:hypothetical protein RCO27_17975 [Sphingosinicella sp. LHD-64]|uniref:hypothetical protein n=1 Tax=Sphingosinicella sp. LHD-64 TaxID=3072139 RepID=UPI00280DCBE2|nr:hypothetical protein [Sphingosinicella sp. LHD-64]MDQ8758118.1 hypothetical protein [Sphingosinicella sp. LHD-64]